MPIAAAYYDGRTARRHDALLCVEHGKLRIQTADRLREEDIQALNIPATLSHTPRLILLSDGARCEVADHAAFATLLPQAGLRASSLAHLENRWRYALAALVMVLGVIVASYVWGLPYIAKVVAQRIPNERITPIDQQFLDAVDGKLLLPSQLPSARQLAITSRLQALQMPNGAKPLTRVLFRSSPKIGANAFALPGGTVVILDEIVKLSDNDEQILGVLAHEMGHVAERHAVRQMLQASVVGLVMAWYVGDVSSLLAIAPSALLETRYSREFERLADGFAAQTMALNHMPAAHLTDMLEKLERAHGAKQATGQQHWLDYLSSHPATDERINTLRRDRH